MQPSLEDVSAPFDPTGYVEVSGAQLLQLVNGIAPYADKGLIMLTSDIAAVPQVPDAVTNTKWQRNMWIRVAAASVGTYVWNPAAASDPTFLQWQSTNIAGIAPGSIVNSMIADNTILDVKIANLSYGKLIGAPTGLPPSGAAGGDLTGVYPNPAIGAGVVTDAKMVAKTLTNASIANKTVTSGLLASDNASGDMLRVQTADSTIVEWFTPPKIFMGAGNALEATFGANANKALAVNGAGNGYALVSLPTLFTSLEVALSSATKLFDVAHGLGGVPAKVRAVLKCNTANAGYVSGDEVAADCFLQEISTTGVESWFQAFAYGANATNIFMVQTTTGGSGLKVPAKSSSTLTSITLADWTAKMYAST